MQYGFSASGGTGLPQDTEGPLKQQQKSKNALREDIIVSKSWLKEWVLKIACSYLCPASGQWRIWEEDRNIMMMLFW